MNMTKNLGLKLLAVWLIITNVAPFVHLNFHGMEIAMPIIAIAAGVLMLIDR